MKVFIVLLALVALVSAEWQPKTAVEIKQIRAECLKEHPLPEATINKLKTGEFPDEEPVRQYLLCSAIKLDIFCSHEGYHADRVAKQFKLGLEEGEALGIVQGCIDKNEQGSPVDVWAYRGHKCLMSSKIGENVRAYIKKKQEEAAQSA